VAMTNGAVGTSLLLIQFSISTPTLSGIVKAVSQF